MISRLRLQRAARERIWLPIAVITLLVALFPAVIIAQGETSSTDPGVSRSLEIGIEPDNYDQIEHTASFQQIFGSDDRTRVSPTTRAPHSSVAFIVLYEGNIPTTGCTGTMIGPDAVLTAAHCLYTPEYGWATAAEVFPARNGNSSPYGSQFATDVWLPSAWHSNQAMASDYAVLRMPNASLGNAAGWLSISSFSTTQLNHPLFNPVLAGYPGEKSFGTMWESSEPAFEQVGSTILQHRIDSTSGQSGGPIWRGDDAIIAGVHIGTTGQNNVAVRITSGVVSNIRSACQEMGCSFSGSVSAPSPADPTPTPTPSPTSTPTPTPDPTPTPSPDPTPTPTTEPDEAGPPAGIAVAIETAEQRAGEPLRIEVTATNDSDDPVEDGTVVTFSVTRDGEPARGATPTGESNDWTAATQNGQASLSYTNTWPGTDTVTVTTGDIEESIEAVWFAELPSFEPMDHIENSHFASTWSRTDLPVRELGVSRTWMWGPGPFTESLAEPYLESPDGEREVIYFDKARAEINHPDGDPGSLWHVTNGLLVVELVTGERQFGDDTFEYYGAAEVNVAGDPDGETGPTYATFAGLIDRSPQQPGSRLTERLNRDGSVDEVGEFAGYEVDVAFADPVTGHGIAGPFWSLMNSNGPVYHDGELRDEALFENPFYATGRPIAGAYWAEVKVGGVERSVLIQCFERRCLTYTPGNPDGFTVETGNVGQHYYEWRYVLAPDSD